MSIPIKAGLATADLIEMNFLSDVSAYTPKVNTKIFIVMTKMHE